MQKTNFSSLFSPEPSVSQLTNTNRQSRKSQEKYRKKSTSLADNTKVSCHVSLHPLLYTILRWPKDTRNPVFLLHNSFSIHQIIN